MSEYPQKTPATPGRGTTADRLYLRAWERGGELEAALLVHGMESHAEWFAAVGDRLATGGLAAIAYDRRGWGRSPGPRGKLAGADAALAELHQVTASLSQRFRRLHLVGLSWGGLLAAYAAGCVPARFATVTLLAPALFPRRRLGLLNLGRVALAMASDQEVDVSLPIDPQDFTVRPEALTFVRNDPHRVTAVSSGFLLATRAMQAWVRRHFRGDGMPPCQALLANTDSLIDNARTERFLKARGTELTIVPGARHSLVFEAPEAVADRILGWARRAAETAGTVHGW